MPYRLRVPTLIFDFGGVILEWDPKRLYRRLLGSDEEIDRFFDEVGFFAWNLEQDRGGLWSEAVADLCGRFPHRRDLIEAYDVRWEESIVGPVAGMFELLEQLHGQGTALVGLSNWSPEKFRLTRPRYPVFDLFEDIILSGDVGLVKPDPRIFAFTLERIGRKAGECLFIDDSAPNVAAAAALGIDTIQFQSAAELEEQLKVRRIL